MTKLLFCHGTERNVGSAVVRHGPLNIRKLSVLMQSLDFNGVSEIWQGLCIP